MLRSLRVRALAVVLVFAGCVQSESVQCADGSVCPRDRMCRLIAESYVCVSDEQIAACADRADFAACSGGTCFDGVCIAPSCGDGRVGPIEVCDDGNTTAADGCSSDCRSDETCGNGIFDLQVGEQCDEIEGAGLSNDGCSSSCREEAPTWAALADYYEVFSNFDDSSLTYDPERGRIVIVAKTTDLFRTIEIDDGGVWSDVTPVVSPAGRTGFVVAHDAHRHRTVLFGGLGFRDTWEWDGSNWQLLAPTTTPTARIGHAMVYDPLHHRVVMFGGRANLAQTTSELGDTWAWNGVEWTQLASGPSPRTDAAMAFDPVRGVIVLYGGTSATNTALADTWEFDGDAWIERTPATAVNPGPRRGHAMTFEPASRTVLVFGGARQLSEAPGTYTWDGASWTLVDSTLTESRPNVTLRTQEGRVVLFGTLAAYEWRGGSWVKTLAPAPGGFSRSYPAVATDLVHRRVLAVGGYLGSALVPSTNIWRGVWSVFSGTQPSGRYGAALAFDVARDQFVLFGGGDVSDYLGDTWVFDDAWHTRAPTVSPSARQAVGIAYDGAREQVVMLGGIGEAGFLGDTWLWNGTTWSEYTGPGPGARAGFAMAYDPVHQEVVAFGGAPGPTELPLGDTWVWNGTWTKRADNGPARSAAQMAWDAARQRLVIYGGTIAGAALSDTWEWDGATWTQVAAAAASHADFSVVPALDGAGVIRFGVDTTTNRKEMARLRWTAAGTREACVPGRDFDGDGLDGTCSHDPDCWRVCTPTCPPGASCASTAVGCGDGTCAADRESCLSCPEDCGACVPVCGDLACNGDETTASCRADCP